MNNVSDRKRIEEAWISRQMRSSGRLRFANASCSVLLFRYLPVLSSFSPFPSV
jgi:hypothetical protein